MGVYDKDGKFRSYEPPDGKSCNAFKEEQQKQYVTPQQKSNPGGNSGNVNPSLPGKEKVKRSWSR